MINFLLGFLLGAISTLVYFYWCDEISALVKRLLNKEVEAKNDTPKETEG